MDLEEAAWTDAGDVAFETPGGTPFGGDEAVRSSEREAITSAVASCLEAGDGVLCLGGDHSVSLPILKAQSAVYPNLTLVQFDAHPDLYDSFESDRYSHACPFGRIMDQGLVKKLVQIGVRTVTGHQAQQRGRFGVVAYDMAAGLPNLRGLSGPIYVSLDLDVLDPAFAPGVSHHEPGGLSTRELISLLHAIPGPIIGADLVELNPTRDRDEVTSMTAAKLCKELLGLMIEGIATKA